MRVLAVDPGIVNIGIAISDENATIATPLKVIKHKSRELDAKSIVEIAQEKRVEKIIVGCSFDEEGRFTFEGRRANRLAAAIRRLTTIPVLLWDEYGSTRQAKDIRKMLGIKRKHTQGHLDQFAAAVILQSFLDDNTPIVSS